jgi:4-hydroxybenzoate polyprenyltransferase
MRLNAPVGWILLALPGFWGYAWACPRESITIVIWVIMGAIWARSLGCFYNDWVDRDLDGVVTRTLQRPLVGAAPCSSMLVFMAFIALAGGALFMYFLPWSCTGLATLGGVGALLYPWAKRVTYYPQILLGLIFNSSLWMAPLIAQCPMPAGLWLLYGYGVLWTISYDTVYAFQDFSDDRHAGIGSLAVKLGFKRGYWVLGVLIVARFSLLAFLAPYSAHGIIRPGAPGSCVGGVHAVLLHYGFLTLMMGYQVWQWWRLDLEDEKMCGQAFRNSVHEGYLTALWLLILSGGLTARM